MQFTVMSSGVEVTANMAVSLCLMRRWSDVGGVGEEAAVFCEDGLDGDDGGVDAEVEGSEAGGFEDDFEGAGTLFWRGAEDAWVAFADDAAVGAEAVDDWGVVAGEEGGSGVEGGFEEVGAKEGSADEAVEAVGGIVFVEGDDDVVAFGAEFGFEVLDFWLGGAVPEFAIEVEACEGVSGTGGEAGGVAFREEVEFEA